MGPLDQIIAALLWGGLIAGLIRMRAHIDKPAWIAWMIDGTLRRAFLALLLLVIIVEAGAGSVAQIIIFAVLAFASLIDWMIGEYGKLNQARRSRSGPNQSS